MQKIKLDKKFLIQMLFGVAVLLLAANLIVSKYYARPDTEANLKNINSSEVNDLLLNDLHAFALKKDWIKQSISRNGLQVISYSVEVPKDLPIPVILNEIYGSMYGYNLSLNAAEKASGGKTVLSIYVGKKLIAEAVFNYNPDIMRKGGSAGLIIEGFEKLGKNELKNLVEFPQTYAALLIPSKKNTQFCDTLLEYRKEYCVLLNDDISDMDYKLSSSFSELRIKTVLRSIISDYSNALFFAIDDHSKLYGSPAFTIVKRELVKRGIKLLRLSFFNSLEGESGSNLISNFISIVKQNENGSQKFILVPADDFNLIRQQIFSFIKIGYKFISPSNLLSAMENKPGKVN